MSKLPMLKIRKKSEKYNCSFLNSTAWAVKKVLDFEFPFLFILALLTV